MLAGEGVSGSGIGAVRVTPFAVDAPSTPAFPADAALHLERPAGTVPGWARLADEAHRSLRRPLPIAADLVMSAAVVLIVSGQVRPTLVATAVLLASGLALGVWKSRSCVQAQGVTWYASRLVPAAAVCAGFLYLALGWSARRAAATALILAAVLVLTKAVLWVLVSGARRRGIGLRRTLVLGSEDQVAEAEHRIGLYREAGLACVYSHVAVRPPAGPSRSRALIGALIDRHSVEHIVCTAGDAASDSLARNVIRYAPLSVDVTVLHPVSLAPASLNRIGDAAVTCLDRPAFGTDLSKRVFDIIVATALLLLLSPVMLISAIAVRCGDPGPAIFRQGRTGRGNQQFTIFKFRSMVRDAEALKDSLMGRNVADGLLFKAEDDPRITRVGNVIRRFSLDELPQLVNVVRGHMSLVGPRPLPTVFAQTDLFAHIRHQVRPGITGLWQVKGANALPYEDMIDLDCSYVATRSLGLDLRILLQTVPAVLVRRDPY